MENTQSSHHDRPRPNYLLVFFGLLALTVLEVIIAGLPIAEVIIIVSLLAFMLFKVILVAMFYMHLRVDSRWFAYIFLIPLPFVALIIGALLIGT